MARHEETGTMTDVKHPFTHIAPPPYVFTGWTKRSSRSS